MKQGGGTIDANALATGRGLSSGSPSVAPVWSSPTTVKTSVGTTGSYIPSYTSWYPTTHQESMQQSQLMWRETSAHTPPSPSHTLTATLPRASGRFEGACSTDNTQKRRRRRDRELAAACRQLTQRPPHAGWRHTGDWKTEKAHNAPKGNKIHDSQRKPSTNGSFYWLLFITFVSVSNFFLYKKKHICVSYSCLYIY